MTSKDYLKDIQMFINEAYSGKEPLQENQIKSKRVFNDYCNEIKQDLGRLEKLEKALEILKDRGGIHLYINRNNDNKLTLDFDDCICCVLEPKEYNLLKEVLENGR